MKEKTQGPKAEAKAARPAGGQDKRQSVQSAKPGSHGGDLEKALALIRKHPGIRPSELNRLLDREESDGLRATLIKRGLIRKEKDGSAMRYYPVDQ
jgi:hypothetical protein